jgi:hypothetical protein
MAQPANRRSHSAARRELAITVYTGHPITSRLPPVLAINSTARVSRPGAQASP